MIVVNWRWRYMASMAFNPDQVVHPTFYGSAKQIPLKHTARWGLSITSRETLPVLILFVSQLCCGSQVHHYCWAVHQTPWPTGSENLPSQSGKSVWSLLGRCFGVWCPTRGCCTTCHVSLFLQSSVRSLELDLGEDRIVLRGHPGLYSLDIFIPYSIVPEESRAQFHKRTKVSNQDAWVLLWKCIPPFKPHLLPHSISRIRICVCLNAVYLRLQS